MKILKPKTHFLLALCVVLSLSLTNCASNRKNVPDDHFGAEKLTSDEYSRLGDLYFNKGDAINAFVHYEKCLRTDPDNTRVLYMKGLLFITEGQYSEAAESFQKVLAKEPDHTLAHQGLGQAFIQMKRYDEAEKYLQKAITLDTTLWTSHSLLGITYDYQKNHRMAIQAYEAALALTPDNGSILNNMGLSYSMAGKHDRAISVLTSALGTNYAQNKTFNNLGVVLFRAGRYQDAFEALQKGGDDAQALNNLGSMFLSQGKNEKARECFEKALVLRPHNYEMANENLRKCNLTPFDEVFFKSPATMVTGTTPSEVSAKDKAHKQDGKILSYRVKEGDNLFSIARLNNMEYGDLIRLNDLSPESIIYPNQVLRIRAK